MKKNINLIIFLLFIPFIIVTGIMVFKNKMYALISLLVAILSLIPFFIKFEKGKTSTTKIVLISVMIVISVLSRVLFVPFGGFKPITAIIIISALYLGSESGFVIGSLSALVSNFVFGQGPWTPFQMFAWGLIGYLAGVFAKYFKKSQILLLIYGGITGIIYSLLMDLWTVLWLENAFNFKRYLALITLALPTTLLYTVANIVFLLILSKPIGNKLNRICNKYGV